MVKISKLGFFTGEYKHNLTERNRIALPKKFRIEIGGPDVILAKGGEDCIEGFDTDVWKEMVKPHLTIPFTEEEGRRVRRRVFSSAMVVELDSQGRVVLPEMLLSWVGLKGKVGEPVVIVGVGDHFEIWEESNWIKKTTKYSNAIIE